MTDATVIEIGRDTLSMMILLMAPAMFIALAVGLAISVIQAATQIQEMTLTFVPKILAVVLALAVLGPWIASQMISFTQRLFAGFPALVR
ncbi:MAG: flagellar biosynthesis protein FliQ [Fimbriimonadaceae bacterium]|nr:flagellar biosynthesis protein FliQ [Fimbriimonadaceae bacterium]